MEANLDEIKGLRRWYGGQPRLVRLATGAMLNHFAFGTRTQAIREINDQMTVRNERFVSGRVRVKKANIRTPVPRQKASTFSVAKDRFTGWTEQEYGTGKVRNRIATPAARNGNFKKQIRHIVRLKPRNPVITRKELGLSEKHTIGQVFATARRKKENRLLQVKGTIYKRRRNKFEPVQIRKSPKRTKRDRWMLPARNRYFRQTDLDALWRRSYLATMGRPPKR